MLEKLERLEENPFGVDFDPIEIINEGLYHSNRDVRQRSLRLIRFLPNAEFIEPLFRIIAEDDDLETRRTAIDALGTFLHHGSIADYDQEPVREDDVPSEETQLDNMSPIQFNAVRDFLGELVNQPEWPPTLRARALIYHAKLAPEEASSRIDQFYRTDDPELKKGAVEAIARIQQGDWRDIIMKELTRQPDDERKRAALEAAGVHGVSEAGPELVKILESTADNELRQTAVETLSLIPWAEAPEHLREFTDDPDEVIRETAENGLRRWAHRMEREEQL